MSDKVRWGIISTAGIAEKSFIPALRETDRGQLVAVSSRSKDTAQAFADQHGIPEVFGSYADMLASDRIDAVYNPLPNTMHAEWTIAAAEAGKHIFCEKPLAMNTDEIRSMVAACEKHSVQLVEAFVFLYHAQSLKLRELLDGGAIGDIVTSHAWFNFRIPRPSDNIRLNKELGGGGLLDGGVYPITFTRFVHDDEPMSLQASTVVHPEYEVDTRFSAILDFADDRQGIVQQSIDGPGGPGAFVVGTEGSITIPQPYHPRAGAQLEVKGKIQEVHPFDDGRHPFTPAVEHFHEVLLDGKSLAVPASNALGTLAVVDAILESAKTGSRISL